MKTPVKVARAAAAHHRKLEKALKMSIEGRQSKNERLAWTILADVADKIKIISYLENNNVRMAAECYDSLDTLPRTEMPVVIADFLERTIGYIA